MTVICGRHGQCLAAPIEHVLHFITDLGYVVDIGPTEGNAQATETIFYSLNVDGFFPLPFNVTAPLGSGLIP